MRRVSIGHTRLWVIMAALALSSCFGATKYRAHTGYKGGFAEARLNENTFKVSFNGNAYTARTTAETYVMYRCAELTIGAGYDRFAILETGGGWTAWSPDGSTATPPPGQEPWVSAGLRDHERHHAPEYSAIIRTFKGEGAPGSHDARELIRYLGPGIRR